MLSCQRLLSQPIRTQKITAEVKPDFLKTLSKKKKQQFKMKKFIEDYLKELQAINRNKPTCPSCARTLFSPTTC